MRRSSISARRNSSQAGLLHAIAFFELLKAALLIALGVGILKLVHKDLAAAVEHSALRIGLDPGSHYVNYLIERVIRIPPRRVRELGIVTFLYAGLFCTEGIGLLLLKRWAEWFTVIATGSLVPVEAYEIYRHPTAIKVAVLAINIGIVVYLIYRIRIEQRDA